MLRTSLYLPTTLHQRLLLTSKQERKSLSHFVGELLDRALTAKEDVQVQRMYKGLKSLRGIGPQGITDASVTINETLYGERGAWRDNHE